MNTGRVSRAFPQANPETVEAALRLGRYGEQFSQPLHGKKQVLADEGSYYIGTNPTIGTPIAQTTSITAYADTAGAMGNFFLFRNTESPTAPSPKRIYMDLIKLLTVQVPTSATSWQWALVLDFNATRYTSGGSLIAPVSPNGDIVAPSIMQMYAGAITTAPAVSKRTVGRGTFRGVIPTTFDEYVLAFGSIEGGSGFAGAAASGRSVDYAPPVIIGPQQNLAFIMWGASNAAAPSFEFEVGWWER